MLLECKRVALAQRLITFSAGVNEGELIHLLGPNGAGKSTLLACLAGLLTAQGQILFCGRSLPEWTGKVLARSRAYLAQQQMPAGGMPVWQFLHLHVVGTKQADEAVMLEICETFQLVEKLARPLSQLSGGEWQRVRLAAVLLQVAQPEGKLLLLDEPFTGLDLAQQALFDGYLSARVEKGLTVIMSGHDINHSLHHAQRVWLLKHGELIRQGSVKDVLQPGPLSAVFDIPFRKLCVDNHEVLTTFF